MHLRSKIMIFWAEIILCTCFLFFVSWYYSNLLSTKDAFLNLDPGIFWHCWASAVPKTPVLCLSVDADVNIFQDIALHCFRGIMISLLNLSRPQNLSNETKWGWTNFRTWHSRGCVTTPCPYMWVGRSLSLQNKQYDFGRTVWEKTLREIFLTLISSLMSQFAKEKKTIVAN